MNANDIALLQECYTLTSEAFNTPLPEDFEWTTYDGGSTYVAYTTISNGSMYEFDIDITTFGGELGDTFADAFRALPKQLQDKIENFAEPFAHYEFRRMFDGQYAGDYDAHGLTGTGGAAEVMSIAIAALQNFINEHGQKLRVIGFSAKEPSRASLYRRMVQRMLPADWKSVTDQYYFSEPGFSGSGLAVILYRV